MLEKTMIKKTLVLLLCMTMLLGVLPSTVIFLAAYDKESSKMAGAFATTCINGTYMLHIGNDAAEYDWKLMFIDANAFSPLTCAYGLIF